jgi:hypothetical protein
MAGDELGVDRRILDAGSGERAGRLVEEFPQRDAVMRRLVVGRGPVVGSGPVVSRGPAPGLWLVVVGHL